MEEPLAAWIPAAAGLACAARLGMLRRALAGTTLRAPCTWALAAIAAAACIQSAPLAGAAPDDRLTYLAGAWSLCPLMALLGAKRPQDRGWQWIVASTAVVLAVPVGQSFAFGEVHFTLPVAWRGLVGGLVALQWVNYLPTRRWGRATGVSLAQLAWLAPFLHDAPPGETPVWTAAGWFALTASVWLPARPRPGAPQPLDRAWLDFRDAYGLLWARRVADRVNQAAEHAGWPVRLSWRGLRGPRTEGERLSVPALEAALRTALRRFVSPEWIDRRMSKEG